MKSNKCNRVLVVHNSYQQRGGEDTVVDTEIALLKAKGHEVASYYRHNNELARVSALIAARDTLWSTRTFLEVTDLIKTFRPTIIHAHNTFPLISPSLYWAANNANIPVVQTLHNFRLVCPQAMLLRDNQVCEQCVGRLPWKAIAYGCYRHSHSQTAALSSMLMLHRAMGTYGSKVSRYIALNDFCKDVFVRGGISADKISVKPNFVYSLPSHIIVEADERSGFLFVGRLSPEKGISTLAEALKISNGEFPCEVVGSGPAESELEKVPGLILSGWLDTIAIQKKMLAARALVMPSLWYETFGLVAAEAFSCGLPVIASRLGAMAELINDGNTGLLFESGNATDLNEKLTWAQSHPAEMARMGINARREYEEKFTPQRNYEMLISIYEQVIAERLERVR